MNDNETTHRNYYSEEGQKKICVHIVLSIYYIVWWTIVQWLRILNSTEFFFMCVTLFHFKMFPHFKLVDIEFIDVDLQIVN